MFDPVRHGFQFSNEYIQWKSWPWSGTQLCGGMAYAALDYYYDRLGIPADTKAPAIGTPLHTYIFERQKDAHLNTIPRFSGYWQWFVPIGGPNVYANQI